MSNFCFLSTNTIYIKSKSLYMCQNNKVVFARNCK